MILIQNTETGVINLKFLLLYFELLSGVKINFHKSEVIVMGMAVEEQARVSRLMNFKQGKFPFIYLGFTMSDQKLTIANNEPLVVAVGKREAPWQGRFMSSTTRLTLIDVVLLTCQCTKWGCSYWQMGPMQALTSIEISLSEVARYL
jgi:hypothetical protein